MIHAAVADPDFAAAKAAFEADFDRGDEFRQIGAGLAIYRDGTKVLDLFGGHMDAAATRPWTAGTLVNIWSASKGIMALAVAQLADRGLVDYDAPVADYWPDFAAAGKAGITVDDVLAHRSGLNGFVEPTTPDDLYDWDLVTGRLARQAPFWTPGATSSYHGMTFGFLTGEIVRRVTGEEPRDYVRASIAEPIGADLWLGVPDHREADVADIVPPLPDRTPATLGEIAARTVVNPVPDPDAPNQRAWRKSQLPAVNVHATADGLARVYAALANGGMLDGVALLSPVGVERLRRSRGGTRDEMLGERTWAGGVALNTTGIYGPNSSAFGHSGWGGSFGAADPEGGLGIGFVVNRMGSSLNGDPRARSVAWAAMSPQPGQQ